MKVSKGNASWALYSKFSGTPPLISAAITDLSISLNYFVLSFSSGQTKGTNTFQRNSNNNNDNNKSMVFIIDNLVLTFSEVTLPQKRENSSEIQDTYVLPLLHKISIVALHFRI